MDGVARQLTGELIAATLSTDGGWVGLEVWTLSASGGGPDLGPLCLWLKLDQVSAAGVVNAGATWPEVEAPFSADRWYCLPGESQAPLFMGLRCSGEVAEATPQLGVPIALTPPPSTQTLLEVGDLAHPADSAPEATPAEAVVVPLLRASAGTIEVLDAATGPCDSIELKLSDISFSNESCEAPATSLHLSEATLRAVLLPPGRDWATGGSAECDR